MTCTARVTMTRCLHVINLWLAHPGYRFYGHAPLPVGHRDRCPRVHKTWLETITSRLGQHFKSELMKQHALLWSEKFSLHSRSMRKGPSMEVLPMVLHCTLKGSKLQSTALSNIPIKITERRDEGTKGRRDEGTKFGRMQKWTSTDSTGVLRGELLELPQCDVLNFGTLFLFSKTLSEGFVMRMAIHRRSHKPSMSI